MWVNCALYNKKETPVAKLGSRGDAKFEQLWAASGYDQGGRRRRVTGGIAAHKYEPDLEPEPKPAAAPRRASSGKSQRNGRRAVRAPTLNPKLSSLPPGRPAVLPSLLRCLWPSACWEQRFSCCAFLIFCLLPF